MLFSWNMILNSNGTIQSSENPRDRIRSQLATDGKIEQQNAADKHT